MFTSRFSPPLPFISLSFLLCSIFPKKVLDVKPQFIQLQAICEQLGTAYVMWQ